MGTSTWLAQYNAPCTDWGDTDIAGHSIIQLSSKAVPDSFKSAWRSAAKQSPRQRSAAFITQTPQHGMNYNSSLSACCLLDHCWLEKGKKHASLVFSFSLARLLSLSVSICLALHFSLPHSLLFPGSLFYCLQGTKATIKFNPKLHLQTQVVTYAVILDSAWDY